MTAASRREQLLEYMERKQRRDPDANPLSPLCPSCRQRGACQGLRRSAGRLGCEGYISYDPRREEWPGIYMEALKKLREPSFGVEWCRRKGRVNALRDALHTIHGFSMEEIRKIEEAEKEEAERNDRDQIGKGDILRQA